MVETVYRVEDVAKHLGVQPYTVREWVRTGILKGWKLGKSWRISESDLEAFIAERRAASLAEYKETSRNDE